VAGFEAVHSVKKTASTGKAVEYEIVSYRRKLEIPFMGFGRRVGV
jgi:hypothetical protein